MQDFDGKVAVVTGAASGMGRAFAERFAQEGMRVVLADVEAPALEATVTEFRQREFDVKPTDDGERSIVLATADKYMGSGRVSYIPLGEDLPVGRYPIEIELIQGEHGYVVLSKTTAGTALERKFLVDREIDRPLVPAP